jgi:hypothetical protein
MNNPGRQSTVLAVILGDEVMDQRGAKRHGRLALEAFVLSGVALAITWPLRGAEGGAVAVFLTSAGLFSRFDALLLENRRAHAGGTTPDAHAADGEAKYWGRAIADRPDARTASRRGPMRGVRRATRSSVPQPSAPTPFPRTRRAC